MDHLADLCHLFGGITPLNVYDLEIRHYLALTRAVDAQRKEASSRG
jgi:hypothetical protein